MGVSEDSVLLAEEPETAIQTCAAALTRAGFKNVSANQGALLVTGSKRPFGQWTKSQITLALREDEGGTMVAVVAQANAQSLSSLASSPSRGLVDLAITELRRSPSGKAAMPEVAADSDGGAGGKRHPLDPDAYADSARPDGWYVDPDSPWRMREWTGGGWGSKLMKTPKETLDNWWHIRA